MMRSWSELQLKCVIFSVGSISSGFTVYMDKGLLKAEAADKLNEFGGIGATLYYSAS